MEIKPIEERAYLHMMKRFEVFVQEMKELCCSNTEVGNEWLNGQDVCFLLKINKRTLQHYRDYGTLAFSRIGNKCYYKVTDVEKLISKSQTK